MVDYLQALKYPVSDIKKYLVGGVINLVWFVIFPLFVVNGYLVRVIQSTIQGNEKMPEWKGFLDLIKHGFFVTAIVVLYMVIPFLLSYASISIVGNIQLPASIDQTFTVPAIPPVVFPMLILTFLIFLGAAFFLPMAIVFYAASEDIMQAFNIKDMLYRIQFRIVEYVVTYLVSVLMTVLFFALIPITTVFSGILLFYPMVFIAHIFAQIFRETTYKSG
jgi:hypothetical protein